MGNKQTGTTCARESTERCTIRIISQELDFIEADLENTINSIAALKRIACDADDINHTTNCNKLLCLWR